jgi:hypothetical protein
MAQISATGAQMIIGGNGGKVWPFNNISTSPQQVLAPSPSRASITFHNPGAVDILIAPNVQANGTPLVPSVGALGGCFRVFANGGSLTVTGECQVGWQAFSASASGNPLTVMESNT